MNPHVPEMSFWILAATVLWLLAGLHAGLYYRQPEPRRWGWGLSLGWLGLFCYGMFLIFGRR